MGSTASLARKAGSRKPLWAFRKENEASELKPTFGFWSLLAFGIGGTVGSGIFVLSGQIASTMAGPATALSWLIAGVICGITALAYAELAAVLLSPGSTYAFAYYGLGEALAVVAAFLVTLEYGVSGAAVARSWGDKVAFWLTTNHWVTCTSTTNCWINSVGGTPFNPGALFISTIMVALILMGVKVEKLTVNILVVLKVALVLFVIITGAVFTDPANLTPFVPPPNTAHNGTNAPSFVGGMSGVMMGATSAFFGFIGFDEVTCMVGEAKNPKRDVPLSVMATILIITVLYVAASVVLTGMVPYDQIDPNEGFGSAFLAVGAPWAMQVTCAGEIFVVLPTVVLVSYIPQARVLYAASRDGHLPGVFQRVSAKGTLFHGGLISGVVMTLIATFVPFASLNDLISGGILLSFILTNTSLVLVRTEQRGKAPLFAMVFAMGVVSMLLNKADPSTDNVGALVATVLFAMVAIGCFTWLLLSNSFGGPDLDTFRVPWVPFVPSLAIFVNWFLLTQLSWLGMGLVLALLVLALLVYVLYGFHHAVAFTAIAEQEGIIDDDDAQHIKCASDSASGPAELRSAQV